MTPETIINRSMLKANIAIAHRRQYPVRLAYALTIHISRGQTIDKAVIDLGEKESSFIQSKEFQRFFDSTIHT